jgi:hypothetical protein
MRAFRRWLHSPVLPPEALALVAVVGSIAAMAWQAAA